MFKIVQKKEKKQPEKRKKTREKREEKREKEKKKTKTVFFLDQKNQDNKTNPFLKRKRKK